MNYYLRHIGDYLKDTAHLSLLEHGVYTRLLDVYYTREAGIPLDDAARLVGARTREEKGALGRVLEEFFTLNDDRVWTQGRAEQEIARCGEKSEKARRSAEKRWSSNANAMRTHSEGIANVDANALQRQCDGNAPNTPLPNTQEKEKKARKRATPLPDGFGISARLRSWAEINGHTLLDKRLEHFVSYARRNGKMYVDWDEALMGAIREDWAKLGGNANGSTSTVLEAPALRQFQ